MILIGDNEAKIQFFLSDEEASIVDKKSTPTRMNMQSSPELRKRLKQEKAQQRNGVKRPPLPKDQLTIDKVIESKRRRTQTAHFGQESSNSGQNTKASSPEDDKAQESSGIDSSSPEKQEMNSEYDYSYDGDSDLNQRGSKLKNRRRNKKHRNDKRNSPSPNKTN